VAAARRAALTERSQASRWVAFSSQNAACERTFDPCETKQYPGQASAQREEFSDLGARENRFGGVGD
jgi:hypothetical protein